MKTEPKRRKLASRCCETCKWWRRGDQSLKRIGNVGNCVWMMPHESDFYAYSKHAPFWAERLARQTISYAGKHCGTYEPATPKQIKANQP